MPRAITERRLLPPSSAGGAGAASRQSLGTAVVGGLAFATITIVFVPIFFVVLERLRERGTVPGESSARDVSG